MLHSAAKRGDANIVHAFLEHGADPNAQDDNGDTPLHHAVFNGHERCVWLLLNKGKADFEMENKKEQTALVKGYLSFGNVHKSKRLALCRPVDEEGT